VTPRQESPLVDGPAESPSPSQSLSPGESPGFLLWRTTLRWQRVMAATLRPSGLTHVQFVLLVSLWWLTRVAHESPSQHRLASHAATDPTMTSQVLRTLEARGLVSRRSHPTDARARLLDVTAPGEELARKTVALVEAADRQFFAAAPDAAGLLAGLRALSDVTAG
jgi:DNA-binding MarR family transcriptional regulator